MKRIQLTTFLGASALLVSGAAAAAGFSLLTSQRATPVNAELAVFVVLFVQWQMLAVIVAKLGVDNIVFAAVTQDPTTRAGLGEHMWTRALPLSAVCAVALGALFSPEAAVIGFPTVLLDVHAAAMLSELNARKWFARGATANALKYPLFFVLLWIVAARDAATTQRAVLLLLLGTTLIRWGYLRWISREVSHLTRVMCRTDASMGVQQTLNQFLTKGDQLLLGWAAYAQLMEARGSEGLREFLFLARYPDIVSGVAVALGGILLPPMLIKADGRGVTAGGWRAPAQREVAYAAVLTVGLLLFVQLWVGPQLSMVMMALFAVRAILILPTNALTYSMVRQGYLRGLLVSNWVSAGVGGAIAAGAYLAGSPILLAALVPAQKLVFLGLGWFGPWRQREPLY